MTDKTSTNMSHFESAPLHLQMSTVGLSPLPLCEVHSACDSALSND